MKPRRYPLEPFFKLTGFSLNRIREIAPCAGPEYQLRQSEGVTERIADRLASAAGFHPWEIWPEMANHVIEGMEKPCADERCANTFLPAKRNQMYCHPDCRQRARWRRVAARKRATRPEQERERKRRWDLESVEYRRKYKARWNAANRDKVNAQAREYRRRQTAMKKAS